jgi:hypothetical protein
MIVRGGVGRGSWVRALVSMAMIVAATPAFPAADETAGPAWLRAPLTRGPVAASFGLDVDRVATPSDSVRAGDARYTNHAWWGIDAAFPLNLRTSPRTADALGPPALGIGLSIAGRGGSDVRGLRYSALVDRRSERAGEWLGVSTGGGSHVLDTRLQLGTGLWRSIRHVETEVGVVSSFVEYEDRQVSHWGFKAWRRGESSWVDSTTSQNVERMGVWHTAQSALRWHYGLMELTATGGVTVGRGIQPRRWAQAIMNVQASRRLKLMAAYGQRPAASIAFDPSARPQTMVGVQLAPWASREGSSPATTAPRAREWTTRRLSDGRTAVRVRCQDASRVEITGDFTDWAPVELTAMGGGRWETALTIPPGLHQVQIRLDGGEWLVPPGLPSTQREFAGAVGVLLLE